MRCSQGRPDAVARTVARALGAIAEESPTLTWSLRIDGEAVPQGRPRFRKTGHAYDPAKSKVWKRKVRALAMLHARGWDEALPLIPKGPVTLHVLVVLPCPKADHRKRNPAKRRPHAVRPDLSNYVKALEDALDGVWWADDGQVDRIHAQKIVGAQDEKPFVELRMEAELP